jgi:hypothetical protein
VNFLQLLQLASPSKGTNVVKFNEVKHNAIHFNPTKEEDPQLQHLTQISNESYGLYTQTPLFAARNNKMY